MYDAQVRSQTFSTNMQQHILSLIKKFISIQSTPGNTKELNTILEEAISQMQGYSIERFSRNGVQSALIYNTKKRPKKFKIILNGHLDTIPGKKHQYTPKIKGNRLYGVGSMDMKANVACLLAAFKKVATTVSYPLALQLVTDEETGGFDGTKYQIEKGVRAEFIIAAEPTNFDIVYMAKGIVQVKISTTGKAAHSAYPWKGVNAIVVMNEFLHSLTKEFTAPRKETWATTVNVSRIETSNQAFNKIPDECSSWIDVRFVPEEANTITKRLRQLLPKGATLDVIVHEPPLHTDKNNEFIQLLKKHTQQVTRKTITLRKAHGSSDVRHYAKVNCPGVEFGPIGGGIGSDAEWVDIPSLEKYYQTLCTFLLSA